MEPAQEKEWNNWDANYIQLRKNEEPAEKDTITKPTRWTRTRLHFSETHYSSPKPVLSVAQLIQI